MELRIDIPLEEFSGLSVDGIPLALGVDYTAQSGSTILTLTAARLQAFEGGRHVLLARFSGQDVNIPFALNKTPAAQLGAASQPSAPAPPRAEAQPTAAPQPTPLAQAAPEAASAARAEPAPQEAALPTPTLVSNRPSVPVASAVPVAPEVPAATAPALSLLLILAGLAALGLTLAALGALAFRRARAKKRAPVTDR
jgi:hypothetical protein